ncbi:hypothetical protein [Erythrobacter ani]|uniref:Uncharacterized protein n=1 Tax=Erythrobacter ani TaxID=2827235 RepID=A0ABS6SR85_9SPHN|nr:hypothetical protein [Erythrobacter ani]MBV7267559.1 hypothetical protein [Erythrobacter ani]
MDYLQLEGFREAVQGLKGSKTAPDCPLGAETRESLVERLADARRTVRYLERLISAYEHRDARRSSQLSLPVANRSERSEGGSRRKGFLDVG